MRALDQMLMGKPSPVPEDAIRHSHEMTRRKVEQLRAVYATMATRQYGVVTV